MSPEYLVGPVSERDLDRIEKIEVASFGKDAYDRKLFAEYLHKCGDLFFGVWRGRKLCGYMVTRKSADGERAELISVAVHPSCRDRGAAAVLMRHTLRRLRRAGTLRFSLTVRVTNGRARGFYEKYGFTKERVVREYYEDGEDGIRMVKQL